MPENSYLDLLNEEQRAAVVHEGSPLLILAGAGSGKTRVITTKIAYLIKEKNIDPWSILSVTFTKKAANEMRERAIAIDERAADAQIRTFHSFGSWFLRKYAEHAGLEPSFTVYDDDDMATLIKKAEPSLSAKEIRTAAHQISLCKDYCLTPEDDLGLIGSEFDLNDIYSKYQKRLRATGNADFGDLIMLPVQILESYSEIADYIHNRFKVIMVDEYQDSNIAQFSICVTRIQNSRIYARKLCRNLKVEVRNRLCRSLENVAVQDCIDDTACILDGDTLACAVPTCVYEISLCAALLHSLNKLFAVLCRMKLEECLTEASGECRCRLCDAALCSCKFCCETGQEIVLCLLRCKDGNRRKNAERISGKEDYVLSSRA